MWFMVIPFRGNPNIMAMYVNPYQWIDDHPPIWVYN
jgi:hypothetical protein